VERSASHTAFEYKTYSSDFGHHAFEVEVKVSNLSSLSSSSLLKDLAM
jgi:hypothetical protein